MGKGREIGEIICLDKKGRNERGYQSRISIGLLFYMNMKCPSYKINIMQVTD